MLFDDEGASTVQKDAVAQVSTDCFDQDAAFYVFSHSDKLVHRAGVRNPDDVLEDDRSLVQVCGGKVAGCPDYFDAFLPSLVVGFCSLERGKKAVMDIDDFIVPAGAEFGGHYLHVSGQYDEVDIVLCKYIFKIFFVGFFSLCDVYLEKRYMERCGNMGQIRVIGDDDGNIAVQFFVCVFQEDFVQAVACFGNQNRYAFFSGVVKKLPLH